MADEVNHDRSVQVTANLRKLLQRHGYGFQYAALREAVNAFEMHRSRWQFEAAEFPSDVNGTDTHVDFVLRRPRTRTFLVCECKRADPSRSDWCFLKAPFRSRTESNLDNLLVENIFASESTGAVYSRLLMTRFSQQSFDLGIETRNGAEHSDSDSGGRNAINACVAQVMRGVNGLAGLYGTDFQRLLQGPPVMFVPVVFTTANLWGSDTDLGMADLRTGIVASDAVSVRPLKWLALQSPISAGLRHPYPPVKQPREFADILAVQHLRTVVFVNAIAIGEFLSKFEVDSCWPYNWVD